MRGCWFHKGLYVETLRALRVPALSLSVVSAVLSLCPLLFVSLGHGTFAAAVDRFSDAARLLRYIPFVAAPLLTLLALRFQMTRQGSDQFFSLPLSRGALMLTRLASVATWLLLIVAVTAAVGGAAAFATPTALGYGAERVILESGAVWTASFRRLFICRVNLRAGIRSICTI